MTRESPPSSALEPVSDRRRALVLTTAPAARQPRVVREAGTLHRLGFDVTVAGRSTDIDPPASWTFVPIDFRDCATTRWQAYDSLVRRALSRLNIGDIERRYWSMPTSAPEILRQVEGCAYDLVIAHNYHLLPIARRISVASRAPLIVDLHEHFPTQHRGDRFWEVFERPYILAILRAYLPIVDQAWTVSRGLAEKYTAEFHPRLPIQVVRSTPRYQELPLRPAGERMDVLFHGKADSRDLVDVLVRSVALWEPRFRLILRIRGDRAYLDMLARLIQDLDLGERVVVEGLVPYEQVMIAANRADIGISIARRGLTQREYGLPNKVFEYTMAGLALCLSGTPEFKRLVDEHGHGVFVDRETPEGVARTINGLTPDRVTDLKRKSLAAARVLCWENEERNLVRIVAQVTRAPLEAPT